MSIMKNQPKSKEDNMFTILRYTLANSALAVVLYLVFLRMFKYIYDCFLYDLINIKITELHIFGVFALLTLIKVKKVRKRPGLATLKTEKESIKLKLLQLCGYGIFLVIIQIILSFIN